MDLIPDTVYVYIKTNTFISIKTERKTCHAICPFVGLTRQSYFSIAFHACTYSRSYTSEKVKCMH